MTGRPGDGRGELFGQRERQPLVAAGDARRRLVVDVRHAGEAGRRHPVRRARARDLHAGAREAILARVEISCASTADRVAAADLGGVAHINDGHYARHRGRKPAPAARAGRELGAAVHLDDAVTSIRWDDSVRVSSRSGEVEADVCVVAVPAGVLDGIVFELALPEPLSRALGLVEYGHAAKLFVPLRMTAAPRAVMNVPERYWSWTATGDGDGRSRS